MMFRTLRKFKTIIPQHNWSGIINIVHIFIIKNIIAPN
nr:MAG TPA: hypothetical protein [Caudoviricetes sp.]